MLRHATIPPERAWSIWSPRPAEMVFLPLGVRLTPVAFAGSTERATLFPPGEGVRYSRHDLAARAISLDLARDGPRLAWSYAKADPFRVVGRWRTELWDAERGIFASRLWSGAFVRNLGPTSFYPLAAGVPTAEQTERLLIHTVRPHDVRR